MIAGYEWIIIIAVIAIFLIWGPSKIVEFAKAIGRAKKEYEKEKVEEEKLKQEKD